jgi:hypothetical protein
MKEYKGLKMKTEKNFKKELLNVLLLVAVFLAMSIMVSSAPIEFGTVVSGSIDKKGDIDTYSFTANANDNILIRCTGFDNGPEIILTSPSASKLIDYTMHRDFFEQVIKLDQTGEYTITVEYSESYSNNLGNYNLFVQRLNNPEGVKTINFGETTSGSIDKNTKLDAHTFTGNANDNIIIKYQTDFNYGPKILLYSPSMSTSIDFSGSNTYLFDQVIKLEETGKYTFIVGDNTGDKKGDYGLFIQRLNDPAQSKTLNFGETISGAIDKKAKIDTYTYNGNSNDLILVRCRSNFGQEYGPKIRLYSPSMFTPIDTSVPRNANFFEQVVKIDETGKYVLLITSSTEYTGTYDLFVQRINNPAQPKAINGVTTTGSIDKNAKMDTYTFSGNANDNINITVKTDFDDSPKVSLYSPSTSNIIDFVGLNNRLFEQVITLDQSGKYTLLVGDKNGDHTGTYTLSILKNGQPITATAATTETTAPTKEKITASSDKSWIENLLNRYKGCEKGFMHCSDSESGCETNVWSDTNNCGDCGKQCPSGYFCLLGSCSENTKENKEKSITKFSEEYEKNFESQKYEEARYYLLRLKDTYTELNQNDKASEINSKIDILDKKIAAKAERDGTIKDLMDYGGTFLLLSTILIFRFKGNWKNKKDVMKEIGQGFAELIIALLISIGLGKFVILNIIKSKDGATLFFAVAVATLMGMICYRAGGTMYHKLRGKKISSSLKIAISLLVSFISFVLAGIIGSLVLGGVLG